MRVVLAGLLVSLLPQAARAENDQHPNGDRPLAAAAPILGGTDAPAGKWPDIAALNDSAGDFGCTGTLIAPTVVLTAEHCMNIAPRSVIIGTTSLARPAEGDVLAVSRRVRYPNAENTFDLGILVLERASRFEPRRIASGWASVDVKDGVMATIAGFGAIDRDSLIHVDELREAMVPITDAECTHSSGCNALARPAGELGAGGMGIDTCEGDSGGPLYLTTEYGTFVAAVTARGYDNNNYTCSEGGIYTRPDKIIPWIETEAGVPVARGPEPTFDPIVAVRGTGGETVIVPNDPKSGDHTYAISTPPANGRAAVNDDGRVRVCPNRDVVGVDQVIVTITDDNDRARKLAVAVPIMLADGDPDDDCDPEDFSTGAGCCDAGRSASASIPLALGVLVIVRRRRRRV